MPNACRLLHIVIAYAGALLYVLVACTTREVVEVLRAGADVNACDVLGETPLFEAGRLGGHRQYAGNRQ